MLFKGFIFVLLFVCVAEIYAGTRVVRSPQFGSFSSANAQAGSFGGPNGGRPRIGPGLFGRPGFGGPGFGGPGGPPPGGPGFGGNPGFGNRPGSTNISISKSISISTGSGGVAKSSAQSSSG